MHIFFCMIHSRWLPPPTKKHNDFNSFSFTDTELQFDVVVVERLHNTYCECEIFPFCMRLRVRIYLRFHQNDNNSYLLKIKWLGLKFCHERQRCSTSKTARPLIASCLTLHSVSFTISIFEHNKYTSIHVNNRCSSSLPSFTNTST